MTQPVLDIQQLHLSFPGFHGDVHALNNVSLQINRGEIVGLVGESGSGKSVTAMLIMRLLPTGSYCVHRGQISCWEKMFLTRGKTASSVARRTSGDDLSGTDDRPQSDTSNRSSDDGRDPPSSTNKSSGSQS